MISLIYGPKGSGKTKRIIESANNALQSSDGNIVYITDQSKHSIHIKSSIRFINTDEYGIKAKEAAMGFVKGILACNNDITKVYIDGLSRMTKTEIEDMEPIFKELEDLALSNGVKFTVTVSREKLPEFLKKYN